MTHYLSRYSQGSPNIIIIRGNVYQNQQPEAELNSQSPTAPIPTWAIVAATSAILSSKVKYENTLYNLDQKSYRFCIKRRRFTRYAAKDVLFTALLE